MVNQPITAYVGHLTWQLLVAPLHISFNMAHSANHRVKVKQKVYLVDGVMCYS